jgi:hypothetical protein
LVVDSKVQAVYDSPEYGRLKENLDKNGKNITEWYLELMENVRKEGRQCPEGLAFGELVKDAHLLARQPDPVIGMLGSLVMWALQGLDAEYALQCPTVWYNSIIKDKDKDEEIGDAQAGV